jgi:hypothetical protein
MAYTPKSSLIKTTGHYTAQQLYAAFEPMIPNDQKANARRLIDRVVVLSKQLGLDEIIAAAVIWIETGAAGSGLPFRSEWWKKGLNAGNLGITGDPKQNAAAQTWSTPEDAANGLMAHLVGYALGKDWRTVWDVDELGEPRMWDWRFDLAINNTPNRAGVKTLGDLNRRWAVDRDDDYGGKLAERANKLMSVMDDRRRRIYARSSYSGTVPHPIYQDRYISNSHRLERSRQTGREVRRVASHVRHALGDRWVLSGRSVGTCAHGLRRRGLGHRWRGTGRRHLALERPARSTCRLGIRASQQPHRGRREVRQPLRRQCGQP